MVLSHWVFSGWHSQLLSGTNCSSYSNIREELQIARNCFNPLCNLFNGRKKEWARARETRVGRGRRVSHVCACSFFHPLFPSACYTGYTVG